MNYILELNFEETILLHKAFRYRIEEFVQLTGYSAIDEDFFHKNMESLSKKMMAHLKNAAEGVKHGR